MKFVIVTGMSGAGKSAVTRYLEDLGYFCVDNLPPALLPKFAEICYQARNRIEKVAVVIDIRGGELFDDFFEGLANLQSEGYSHEIIFLEASDEALVKRFKETRRTHPLSNGGRIIDGIAKERSRLQEVRQKAAYIIDTSNLSLKDLKNELKSIVEEGKNFGGIIINVISFGFKYGIPIDCDLVFDVRFIPNPYYVETLRKFTGKNEHVREYVLNNTEAVRFVDKLHDMLELLIPYYIREGKTQLIVGIGCTGGRHRSVVISEEISKQLVEMGQKVIICHRDINKESRGA